MTLEARRPRRRDREVERRRVRSDARRGAGAARDGGAVRGGAAQRRGLTGARSPPRPIARRERDSSIDGRTHCRQTGSMNGGGGEAVDSMTDARERGRGSWERGRPARSGPEGHHCSQSGGTPALPRATRSTPDSTAEVSAAQGVRGMNSVLWRKSAVELAAMIRTREVSCVEVVESVLESHRRAQRAHQRNRGGVLRGRVCAPRSRRIGRSTAGVTLGPLHGVPVTIKENIDVAGQATTNGLPVFADLIAPDHSPGGPQPARRRRRSSWGAPTPPSFPCAGPPTTRCEAGRFNPVGRRGLPGRLLRRGVRPPRRWGSDRFTTATTSAGRSASRRSRAGSRR